MGCVRKMGYDQGNGIRSKEKRTDIFHSGVHPVQEDGMAFGCRCDVSGISQIPWNLARSEIKVTQTFQNNADQTLKVAIYIH